MVLSGSDIANPVHELYNGRDNSNESWRIFGNAYIDIKPIDGLTLKSNLGIEHVQFFSKTLGRRIQPSDMNSVSRGYGQGDTYTWTNTANYMKTFGGVHHLNALLGSEFIKYRSEGLDGTNRDYAFEDVDYMQIGAGGGEQTVGGSKAEWALFSLFGKLDYNYADRYLVSATLRRDQTSRLHKDNNSGIFPAFSAAWRASEESFFPKNNIVNDLKVRVAWGQNGNSAISDNYAYYTRYAYNLRHGSYDLNGTNNSVVPGIVAASSGNRDLKWETTTQTNFGLDFGLFRNALYGSLEWYFKKTKDILVYMPGIGVMGEGSSQWINAGEMENKGVELNVGYRGKVGDFQYDIAANIGTYRNEVTKLPETIAAKGTFGGNGVESVVGHPLGAQVGYVYDGIFKSQDEIDNHATQNGAGLGRIRWKDLNNDGVINEKDQEWIYSPVPDFTWGLNIYLQYKNFDLSMFWQGVQGVDVISDLKKETDLWSGLNISNLNKGERLLDAWSPVNMDSNIPAISTMDNNNEKRVSSYFVENGSYAKLRTIQLGYNFPKSFTDKLYMQRLRVYVSAQNLLTIKSGNFTGVDPENANFGYPIPLNVTFGLNVSF